MAEEPPEYRAFLVHSRAMNFWRNLGILGVSAATVLASVGCGGGSGGARVAVVKSGEMPASESWDGVYFHPVYGYLHLKKEAGSDGDSVVGAWKRADQSHWGELSGKVTGNVLHFQWKEHKIGLVGAAAEAHGKGVFVYKVGKEPGIAELDGQFGLNDDEAGSDWHNVKQQRMEPDLKSVRGDAGSGGHTGGGWN